MADQQSFDEDVATGEARSGSSKLIAGPQSPPPHTEASAKNRGEEHVDRPATPTTQTIVTETEEHRSPVPSTNFSEAPTLLTTDSAYTANTGGRANQLWRGGIANFWNPPSTFLSHASDTSLNNEESIASLSTDIPPIEAPLIELPAAHVTGPDEPRSFFESDSESEGETIIRTASRASSLRGRPRLIEHHSSNGSPSRTRFYQPALLSPPRNPGPCHSKAEQILGTKLKNLLDLTPAGERSNPLASVNAATLDALTANEVAKASTTALAPSTPSLATSIDSSVVMEVPNTPTRAEALDTLPYPSGGFGSLRLSGKISDRIGVSPLDALRSNPVTRLDAIGIHRAISAPPLTHRRNRKVMIRPVDMEIIHTANQKKLFRDSVVSTPYPTRHHSVAIADVIQTPVSQRKNSSAPTTEKDSRQSVNVSQISPPEILVLELSLAKHPLTSEMTTIPIYDRSTFDDCALFSSLRNTYNHTLLGFTLRFLTARTVSSATFIFPSSICCSSRGSEIIPFDTADFLKHLHHPKSGHRRKTWLQWLRKHQPSLTNSNNKTATRGFGPTSRSGSTAAASPETYFSADGIPRTPAFVDPRPPPPPPPQAGQSYLLSPSNCSPSSSSSPPSASTYAASSPSAPVPKVILHHSFSLPRIATAISLVLALTVLATTLWVLFRGPGSSAADGLAYRKMMMDAGGDASANASGSANANADADAGAAGTRGWDWRVDAQKRVLAGCVMGLLVFLMGTAGVVGWVGGSWAVL